MVQTFLSIMKAAQAAQKWATKHRKLAERPHNVNDFCRGPYKGVQVPNLPTVLLEDGQLGSLQPALPRVPVRLGDPCAQCELLEHCWEHYCQGEHSLGS